jgi:hypothetical protein
LALHRYVYRINEQELGIANWIAKRFASPRIKKAAYYQGYFRHTKQDVYSIGQRDLKAINDFIGNSKFLLGNEACNEDAR